MDLTTITSVAVAGASLGGAVFGYIGYVKGVRKDSQQEGRAQGDIESRIKNVENSINSAQKIESNITYIMRRSDDLLLEQRDTNKNLSETNKNLNILAERVTRCEESTKSAHKRIDDIERKPSND